MKQPIEMRHVVYIFVLLVALQVISVWFLVSVAVDALRP